MHFLNKKRKIVSARFAIGRRWACVTVEWTGKILTVKEKSIAILRPDAHVAVLPKDVEVLGPDGKIIRPQWGFYVTTETFDPFHALVDVPSKYPIPL